MLPSAVCNQSQFWKLQDRLLFGRGLISKPTQRFNLHSKVKHAILSLLPGNNIFPLKLPKNQDIFFFKVYLKYMSRESWTFGNLARNSC